MNDLIPRAAAMDVFMGKPPDFYHTSYIVSEINCLPSVDAIPVEWLRKWPKDLREGAYVRDILTDWQKEQEAHGI